MIYENAISEPCIPAGKEEKEGQEVMQSTEELLEEMKKWRLFDRNGLIYPTGTIIARWRPDPESGELTNSYEVKFWWKSDKCKQFGIWAFGHTIDEALNMSLWQYKNYVVRCPEIFDEIEPESSELKKPKTKAKGKKK